MALLNEFFGNNSGKRKKNEDKDRDGNKGVIQKSQQYLDFRNRIIEEYSKISSELANEFREHIYKWEEANKNKELKAKDLCEFLISSFSGFDEEDITRIIANSLNKEYITLENIDDIEIDYEVLKNVTIVVARDELFVPIKVKGDYSGNVYLIGIHGFYQLVSWEVRYIASKTTILSLLDRADQELIRAGNYKIFDNYDTFFQDVIQKAVRNRSSDIHIEYYPHLHRTFVKVRQDGMLRTLLEVPNLGDWHLGLINYVFSRADIDAGMYHKIYDRQIEVQAFKNKYELRLSVLPTQYKSGEYYPQLCFRIMVSAESKLTTLDKLGYNEDLQYKIIELINKPNGIIYVCGPTGSGKNTTLYACLDLLLKTTSYKILSIEDPVEKRLLPNVKNSSSIVQVEVNEKREITFASALRSFLRHDPDVIFIGETRDEETAIASIKAALTGHLVFSTIHVNTSIDIVPRLVNTLGVDRDLLSSALKGVISQRLVRKICQDCCIRVNKFEIEYVLRSNVDGVFRDKMIYNPRYLNKVNFLSDDDVLLLPVGCNKCNGTGFYGRTVLPELLLCTNRNFKEVFYEVNKYESFKKEPECVHMSVSAYELIKKQVTSLDEALRFIDLNDFEYFVQKQ